MDTNAAAGNPTSSNTMEPVSDSGASLNVHRCVLEMGHIVGNIGEAKDGRYPDL
jgi:hypothetical protein